MYTGKKKIKAGGANRVNTKARGKVIRIGLRNGGTDLLRARRSRMHGLSSRPGRSMQQVNAIWSYQTPKLSVTTSLFDRRRQHVAARAVKTADGQQQPTPVPTSLPFFITIIKLLFVQSSNELKRHHLFSFFFVPVLWEDTCFSPISCAGCTTTKGYWISRGKKIGLRR